MTVFQAVVLGVLQGLAEFLPISSSAHLTLAPWLFGWPDPGLAFDVALHVGTLAAVLWFFRAEWVRLVAAGLRVIVHRGARTAEEKRAVFLVIATIPGGIGGLLLGDLAESTFRSPSLIAVALIVMGVLLWVVDRMVPATRELDSMRWTDALLVGLAQVCALVPGVSRSGSTITGGRLLRFDRQSAAVFSFLMSMPITAAAALHEVPKAIAAGGFGAPLVAGVLASAVSGWLAIAVLLRYLGRHDFAVFAIYRFVLGAIVLLVVAYRG
jgi:undecaprenyl-diphosphatase